MRRCKLACGWLVVLAGCGSGEAVEPPPSGLPRSLPFEISREGLAPLPEAEVAAFTKEITGFLADVKYWEWVQRVSHGVHASTGKPDYAAWWHDVEMVKKDGVVTFRHAETGGGHNIYIPTSEVLAGAASGWLLTGDTAMGEVVTQYAKAFSAACRGLMFDANDPNPYLMARNFVGQNHSYELPGGRRAAVDFSGWFNTYTEWNAQRLHFPNNPYWGDIWVTNMRSKDDVPHIYLAALVLRYVVDGGPEGSVRDAAALGLDCIRGFTKDIVDSGYLIRTKDAEGKAFVPSQDLASFVQYDDLVPNGECAAKAATAYLGYGDARGNACGRADTSDYEAFATEAHFYNYSIIRGFHIAAAMGALEQRDDEAARRLVNGLGLRATRAMAPASDEPGLKHPRWLQELAIFLIESASAGMPLTPDEARLIQSEYRKAIEAYRAFERWDVWDAAVPDGRYPPGGGFLPSDQGKLIPPELMGHVMLYCNSAFRSGAGASPVDCGKVKDVSSWGR